MGSRPTSPALRSRCRRCSRRRCSWPRSRRSRHRGRPISRMGRGRWSGSPSRSSPTPPGAVYDGSSRPTSPLPRAPSGVGRGSHASTTRWSAATLPATRSARRVPARGSDGLVAARGPRAEAPGRPVARRSSATPEPTSPSSGGGYTGLWTAFFVSGSAPVARGSPRGRDLGGGARGRNGGFVDGLVGRAAGAPRPYSGSTGIAPGEDGQRGRRDRAVDRSHGIDAWFRRSGSLLASAAPAQDGALVEVLETCDRSASVAAFLPLTPGEVPARSARPPPRWALMAERATVQPARLARGLRRVLIERGVTIYEGTLVDRVRPRRRRAADRSPSRRTSPTGPGRFSPTGRPRAQRMGRRLAVAFGPPLITGPLHRPHRADPGPARRARLDRWRRGRRREVHPPLSPDDPRRPGRLRRRRGRAGCGGRIGARSPTTRIRPAGGDGPGAVPGLADVRIEDAWGGPIDICDDHRPFFGSLPGGRLHLGHGYSGNGVGPAHLGGRILAALALGGPPSRSLELPIVGRRPRRFPPEPFRSVGARLVREAIVRREEAEQAGRPVSPIIREVSRLPGRFGYRLGLD